MLGLNRLKGRGNAVYGIVKEVVPLSPSLARVVLTDGSLDQFRPTEFTDQYINASFVAAGSPLEPPFTSKEVKAAPSELQPRPRRFTVRSWNAATRELVIDFVVHGDVGYAGAWAQRARPGDRLQFKGPGGSYRPSPDVDWHLLVGDESAFGAIGASLDSLDAGARALVFALVEDTGYEIELPSLADVTITWLHRANSSSPETLLARAVEGAEFPPGSYDAFVHGEADETWAVRRHLLTSRNAKFTSISPYWRRHHTDEAWRDVKRAWMAEQKRDV